MIENINPKVRFMFLAIAMIKMTSELRNPKEVKRTLSITLPKTTFFRIDS